MGWNPHRVRLVALPPTISTATSAATSSSTATPTTSATSPSVLVLLLLLLLAVEKCSSSRPQPTDDRTIKMCSDRLLQGIQSFCRNPGSFQVMMAFGHKRKRSHAAQDQDEVAFEVQTSRARGRLEPQLEQELYEEDDEDEEDQDDDQEGGDSGESAGGGREEAEEIFQEEASSTYNNAAVNLETRRRNIVEACCRNACSEHEFLQYCAMSRQGERRKPPVMTTTTSTTTTTTTPPPPLEQQNLPRHRFSLGKSRSEEEIRSDLIREAIRCLYDPKCGGNNPKEMEMVDGRQSNSSIINKEKKKNGSKIQIPTTFTKFCSQSWRKRGMSQEEKQSHLLPILLRMLTWGIPKQRPQTPPQPQFSPRVAPEPVFSSPNDFSGGGGDGYDNDDAQLSPDIRGQNNHIPRLPASPSRFTTVVGGGGGGGNVVGGKFGVPSFANRGHHGQQGHRQRHTHQKPRPHTRPISNGGGGRVEMMQQGEQQRQTVTDPPIKPNVGFGLGTHDGVQFNN